MVNKKQVGIGASALAAAAAAAAAGYYFYASKDAAEHRKIAAKWAGSLKQEALAQVKKLEEMDRAQVIAAIDTAVAAYERARAVEPAELARAARELKNNWRSLIDEAHAKRSGAVKKAKKIVKKAAKKAPRPARTKKSSE